MALLPCARREGSHPLGAGGPVADRPGIHPDHPQGPGTAQQWCCSPAEVSWMLLLHIFVGWLPGTSDFSRFTKWSCSVLL